MARSTPGVTRQRIVDEAVVLFAARGFAATSVADIQAACGLTSGSGALYKHFASKAAVLEEAVRQNLDAMAARNAATVARLPDDPRAVLRLLVDAVWQGMHADRALIRLMVREFDGFPELFERMWQSVLANLYRVCAEWIAGQCALGRMTVADPVATAGVLVSSLTYYPLLDTLIGRVPGNVAPERFRAAWLEHAERTLGLATA